MLVRALVSFVSPLGSPGPGDTLDVSPEVAAAWTRAGLVERAAVPIETAVRSAPEAAVLRKGRR